MAFEAFAEAGPICEGDSIFINYCNCPDFNLVAIRVISPLPAPPVTFTPYDGGVQIDGADIGTYQFEVLCCEELFQDFDNPYTQIFIPDR